MRASAARQMSRAGSVASRVPRRASRPRRVGVGGSGRLAAGRRVPPSPPPPLPLSLPPPPPALRRLRRSRRRPPASSPLGPSPTARASRRRTPALVARRAQRRGDGGRGRCVRGERALLVLGEAAPPLTRRHRRRRRGAAGNGRRAVDDVVTRLGLGRVLDRILDRVELGQLVPVLHARQRIQARGMEDEVAVAAQHAQPAAVAAARAIVLPLPKAASSTRWSRRPFSGSRAPLPTCPSVACAS
jgi:hypothetical protein